jgi:CBS domain-containing protein
MRYGDGGEPGSLVGDVFDAPTTRESAMRARDLAVPFPSVLPHTPVIEAARVLAGENLPGLVVLDAGGRPTTILPGTDVLKMAVPRYCLSDPTLARVVDEAAADVFVQQLAGRTVSEVLPDEFRELPVVGGDATVLEMAALMARAPSPLVAVVDAGGAFTGVVTLDALLDRVLAS